MDDKHADGRQKLPDDFGKQVLEFTKLSTDAYRNGSMQGQLKLLQELQVHIQQKIDEIQKEYDQTEVGSIMKKVRDG
jgi:hypothetical protein